MADKIEILYESDLWDKSGECELLFLGLHVPNIVPGKVQSISV